MFSFPYQEAAIFSPAGQNRPALSRTLNPGPEFWTVGEQLNTSLIRNLEATGQRSKVRTLNNLDPTAGGHEGQKQPRTEKLSSTAVED